MRARTVLLPPLVLLAASVPLILSSPRLGPRAAEASDTKTYPANGKPFAPAYLNDQLVAAGVPVVTVRAIGPTQVEIVTTPAANDATVAAVVAAHVAEQDPGAAEDAAVRSAFQALKAARARAASATGLVELRAATVEAINATATVFRRLYRKSEGREIE